LLASPPHSTLSLPPPPFQQLGTMGFGDGRSTGRHGGAKHGATRDPPSPSPKPSWWTTRRQQRQRSSPAQIRLADIFRSPPRGQIRWRRPRIGRRRCRCGSCGADLCCTRDGDAARQVRRDGQLLHLKIVFLVARSRDGCGTRPYKYNFTRPRNYLCSSEFGPKKKHRVIIRPNP